MARDFAAGDRVLLVDAKRRRHLITLAEGGEFHTHAGVLAHGDVIRDDFARRARTNVEGFLGADVPLHVEVRDVYDGIGLDDLDRILLDLPEPWRVVKHAEQALHPGGILLAYLPTIGQVSRLREELAGSPFGMIETLEVLQRTWHVDGQSVRPDHRMVAHTGFLTHARLLAPGA